MPSNTTTLPPSEDPTTHMDSCEMAPPTPPEEVDPSPRRKRGRRKMEPLEPKDPNMEAETQANQEAVMSVMEDLSEPEFQKEEEPAASLATPTPQQHTDPASPTIAMTPEPVARGHQATPRDSEYKDGRGFGLSGVIMYNMCL
ncbi:DNA (cytosine-5)-methyltransferase 3A [Salvelinus sp. IW2-2015]|uniref:DNA (cytosine-5)-methyltransferase 3A n=1 Tax=Salvelinus sp. IW2-2015 TaxID=2691554 RepID=UPI0038D41005